MFPFWLWMCTPACRYVYECAGVQGGYRCWISSQKLKSPTRQGAGSLTLNLLPSPDPVSQKSKQSKENLHLTSHKNQDRGKKTLMHWKQNAAAPQHRGVPRIPHQHTHLHFFLPAERQPLNVFSSALLVFFAFPESEQQEPNALRSFSQIYQNALFHQSRGIQKTTEKGVVYKDDEDAWGSYTQRSALSHLSTAEAAAKVTQSSSPQTKSHSCVQTHPFPPVVSDSYHLGT